MTPEKAITDLKGSANGEFHIRWIAFGPGNRFPRKSSKKRELQAAAPRGYPELFPLFYAGYLSIWHIIFGQDPDQEPRHVAFYFEQTFD